MTQAALFDPAEDFEARAADDDARFLRQYAAGMAGRGEPVALSTPTGLVARRIFARAVRAAGLL